MAWISGGDMVGVINRLPLNEYQEMFGIGFRRINNDAFTIIGEGGALTSHEMAQLLVDYQPIPEVTPAQGGA